MKKYAIKCTEENKGLPLEKHFVNHPCLIKATNYEFEDIGYYCYVNSDGIHEISYGKPKGYEVLTLDQANALFGVFPRKMLYSSGSRPEEKEVVVVGEYGDYYFHKNNNWNTPCVTLKKHYKELQTETPIKKQLEERAKKLENELTELKSEISKLD